MAGIKNPYQAMGMSPLTKVKGKDIYERDYNLRTMNVTVYCRLCGNEISEAPQDAAGQKVDPVWERQNRVHYKCILDRS